VGSIGAAAVVANQKLTFFQKGVGDSGGAGWPSTVTLTARHTNVGNEGKLPNGEFFVVTGVGFCVERYPQAASPYTRSPYALNPNTLYNIGRGVVSYTEGQGTTNLPLGLLQDMPARNYAQLEYSQAGLTTGIVAHEGVRHGGPLYMRKKPIAVLRGGDKQEQNRIEVTFPEAFTLREDTLTAADPLLLTCNLYGIWFQNRSKTA
jgi:hypothetical protein